MRSVPFYEADILLPDLPAAAVDAWQRWAVIACDQFTSEPAYWQQCRSLTAGSASALDLILPEVWLDRREELTPDIHSAMDHYCSGGFFKQSHGMMLISRTLPDGRVRQGILGCIDLMDYDWSPDSTSLIRATEKTVAERLPPRMEIRSGACVELPHAMLLMDDKEDAMIPAVSSALADAEAVYDFDLMLGGGHITGKFLREEEVHFVQSFLSRLGGDFLFAVGDGNHSIAAAKECFEALRRELGEEAAMRHPARYTLAELVNLHTPALDFEPIYRVAFGADFEEITGELSRWLEAHRVPGGASVSFTCVSGEKEAQISDPAAFSALPVAVLQRFLDAYTAVHPEVTLDYIHGEDSVHALSSAGAVGFLFRGMSKADLFPGVAADGVLPRKTFSMGHAKDKRYYIEARRIL